MRVSNSFHGSMSFRLRFRISPCVFVFVPSLRLCSDFVPMLFHCRSDFVPFLFGFCCHFVPISLRFCCIVVAFCNWSWAAAMASEHGPWPRSGVMAKTWPSYPSRTGIPSRGFWFLETRVLKMLSVSDRRGFRFLQSSYPSRNGVLGKGLCFLETRVTVS